MSATGTETWPDEVATAVVETVGADSRRRCLLDRADTIGRPCAAQERDALKSEGRAIAGGWPGTIREMRARVNQRFSSTCAWRTTTALTQSEHEAVTRTAYASACKDWLRHAVRDEG